MWGLAACDAVVMSLLGHEDLGGAGAGFHYVETGCYGNRARAVDVLGCRY